MKKKSLFTAALSLVLILALTPVLHAFSDVSGHKAESHILSLKERGVINGVNSDAFNPDKELTYAQAVSLLDRAFELDLSRFRFAKQPVASDMYENVANDQWYSEAFVEGYYNGVEFAADVNPNDSISREEFASILMAQVDRKGDYPLIEIYIDYLDAKEVQPDYSNAIQKLLILKFAELTEDQKFNPTQSITRGEAALWLDKALLFADKLTVNEEVEPSSQFDNVKLTTEALTDTVNKVTISADVPHPGYGIKVTNIKFVGDIAYVDIEIVEPLPDMMYPQVITNVSASIYVDKQYKVEVVEKQYINKSVAQ